MKKLAISLAIGLSALLASGANAAPLATNLSMQPNSGIEHVRLVCDEYGRCVRTRADRRIVVEPGYRESYGYYGPRERYIERRDYYDHGPSVGIGVGPGGVGVGVGVGPGW
jgi:hypothetical protein